MSHLFGVGLQVEINKINNSFRMILAKRGRVNAHTIGAVFRDLDANGNYLLEPAEFEKGLARFGLFPTKVQLQALFKYYDVNQDGTKIEYLISVKLIILCLFNKLGLGFNY